METPWSWSQFSKGKVHHCTPVLVTFAINQNMVNSSAIFLVRETAFAGKGCKPHPNQPDQWLVWLLAKDRDAEILREKFPAD